MLSVSISGFATKGFLFRRDQKRVCASILLSVAAILLAFMASAEAQTAQPQFDQLAAQAAQARDAGNLAQAVELYRQATAQKPDWQEGWWYLGLLQYGANQYSPAIDAFTHLLQLEPHAVPALALRGLCEFEVAAYNDSLRDLDTALAHGAASDPRNAQILRFHLAQLLTRAGRFQDALAQYRFFAQDKVENPELDAGIGMAGMRVGALVSNATQQDRVLYEAAGHAGWLLLANNSMEADARFRQLFAQYPTTRNLHFMYGFMLFPHDAAMAEEQFRQELAVAPDNTSARALLAFTLMIAGHYAEARTEAERALAEEPEIPMAQIALGRALGETGDYARGEELLKKVLSEDPQNEEARMGLIAIYSHTGRAEEARRERLALTK
jgi:tetratricopeptide (TPR) repeat protein